MAAECIEMTMAKGSAWEVAKCRGWESSVGKWQPPQTSAATVVQFLREAAFEIGKQSLVDRGQEFCYSPTAVLPLGSPQHEGCVVFGNRKDMNLAIVPRHVILRNCFRPVIDALAHDALRIVDGVQGFVESVVQDAFGTDLRAG